MKGSGLPVVFIITLLLGCASKDLRRGFYIVVNEKSEEDARKEISHAVESISKGFFRPNCCSVVNIRSGHDDRYKPDDEGEVPIPAHELGSAIDQSSQMEVPIDPTYYLQDAKNMVIMNDPVTLASQNPELAGRAITLKIEQVHRGFKLGKPVDTRSHLLREKVCHGGKFVGTTSYVANIYQATGRFYFKRKTLMEIEKIQKTFRKGFLLLFVDEIDNSDSICSGYSTLAERTIALLSRLDNSEASLDRLTNRIQDDVKKYYGNVPTRKSLEYFYEFQNWGTNEFRPILVGAQNVTCKDPFPTDWDKIMASVNIETLPSAVKLEEFISKNLRGSYMNNIRKTLAVYGLKFTNHPGILPCEAFSDMERPTSK